MFGSRSYMIPDPSKVRCYNANNNIRYCMPKSQPYKAAKNLEEIRDWTKVEPEQSLLKAEVFSVICHRFRRRRVNRRHFELAKDFG